MEKRIVFAKITRDWPDARGYFTNATKDFQVWVNESEHIKVVTLKTGGNMNSCFKMFSKGLRDLENLLGVQEEKFSYDAKLGFLTACPDNLGKFGDCYW